MVAVMVSLAEVGGIDKDISSIAAVSSQPSALSRQPSAKP
jgi:hypothetical protein